MNTSAIIARAVRVTVKRIPSANPSLTESEMMTVDDTAFILIRDASRKVLDCFRYDSKRDELFRRKRLPAVAFK